MKMPAEILNGASLHDEMVYLDCRLTKNSLKEVWDGRAIYPLCPMALPLVFSSKVGYALSRGVQHGVLDCSHEKEQRMKTFAFERWCNRHQLPTATRDFVLLLLLAASRDDS